MFRFIFICGLFIFLSACSKEEPLYKPSVKSDPYLLYKEGYEALVENNYFAASKKFAEAELNFNTIELAAKSAMMTSYSLYGINFYVESLESIKRYLKQY